MKSTKITNMPFTTFEHIIDFVCRYNLQSQDCRIVVISGKYQTSETLISTYTIKLRKYYTAPKLAQESYLKDISLYKQKTSQLFDGEYKLFLNINTKYTIEA